jgi:hypothetical protein
MEAENPKCVPSSLCPGENISGAFFLKRKQKEEPVQ